MYNSVNLSVHKICTNTKYPPYCHESTHHTKTDEHNSLHVHVTRITGKKTVVFLVAGMLLIFREYRRRKAGVCIFFRRYATHIFEHLRCNRMCGTSEFIHDMMPYYATIYVQRILIAYMHIGRRRALSSVGCPNISMI